MSEHDEEASEAAVDDEIEDNGEQPDEDSGAGENIENSDRVDDQEPGDAQVRCLPCSLRYCLHAWRISILNRVCFTVRTLSRPHLHLHELQQQIFVLRILTERCSIGPGLL